MGYHPRIECNKIASFQTTRSHCSELWFVNNKQLEQEILGYAAKYSERYQVKLYALSVEGNHIQFPALFPKANRAHFMRDFNASVARAVPRRQTRHPGGRFWARRYSAEYLPGPEDIEEQFFYTVLQPVQDGLVDDISQYPGYNCFEDAISGTVRTYPVVNWKKYNDARRWDEGVAVEDFVEYHELRYRRLPGYENMSKAAYKKMMRENLRERTAGVLEARRAGGKKAVGARALKKVVPGTLPKHTKSSGRYDHRPRVLSKDKERLEAGKTWYFSIYFDYKEASEEYRAGNVKVKFPPGTYKPPVFTVACDAEIT